MSDQSTTKGVAHTHIEAKPPTGLGTPHGEASESAADRGAAILATRIEAEQDWGGAPQRMLAAVLADLMAAAKEDTALSFDAALESARRV